MNTIKVNAAARTLEMTKAFSKKAAIYGSDEYMMLQKARKDYPHFTPTVKTATKKTINKNSGLTYEYMVSFIDKMENVEKKAQIMDEYRILRGLDENDEQIAESESYETIKKWFLNTFPQIEDFGKKYDALKAKREALLKKMAA